MPLYRITGFDRLEFHGNVYERGDTVEMPARVATSFEGKVEPTDEPETFSLTFLDDSEE